MDFLSAKQISELWNISVRRVEVLAAQGRIPGTKQVDGRWKIPADAVKPTDPRKKSRTLPQTSADRYVFPLILTTICSEEQLQDLTPEEGELYRLCLLYEQGRLREARVLAERLLSSSNRYIRIGALYQLTLSCVYLADYPAAEKYFVLFHTACCDETEHKAELDLLSQEINAELLSASDFSNSLAVSDLSCFPDSLVGSIASFELFAAITRFVINGTVPNIIPYEALCRLLEGQGYFYCAILMHLNLSIYYGFIQDGEKEHRHLKAAVDSGLTHGILLSVAAYLAHNLEAAEKLIPDYPPRVVERFNALAKIFVQGRNGYADYRGKSMALANLNSEDYALISCCMKKFSIEQMAESFGITRSGINKRLAVLYKKLGVKSMNEMVRTYRSSVLNWSKD